MGRKVLVVKAVFLVFVLLFWSSDFCMGKIYKYKNENDVWVFTDTPPELPEGSEQVEQMDGMIEEKKDISSGDIRIRPVADLKSEKSIETAKNATAAIQTPIHYAAGFFITPDGFLLTNRHVLLCDEYPIKGNKRDKEYSLSNIRKLNRAFADKSAFLHWDVSDMEEEYDSILSINDPAKRKAGLEKYKEKERHLEKRKNDLMRRIENLHSSISLIRNSIEQNGYGIPFAKISDTYTIRLQDGSEHEAALAAEDEEHNLALLKLNGVETPYLAPVKPDSIPLRAPVFVITYPSMNWEASANGILSGLDKPIVKTAFSGVFSGLEGHFIKTDAPINSRNTGGPLITWKGGVLGVSTSLRLTKEYEGLGFAISIETALKVFKRELGGRVMYE